jgi:hypothetical protein
MYRIQYVHSVKQITGHLQCPTEEFILNIASYLKWTAHLQNIKRSLSSARSDTQVGWVFGKQ